MNRNYDVKTYLPCELDDAEFDRCLEIIERGGAVNLATAKDTLPKSQFLSVIRKGNEIIGIGAIKCIRTDYTSEISHRSNFPFPNDTAELGYVAVDVRHRNEGISRLIVEELLSQYKKPLFATTSSDYMKNTLEKSGFALKGQEWNDHLSLWMKSIEFTPHAISYLDILGFSRFIEEAETNQGKLESLEKLIYEVIPREISLEGKNSAFPKDLELSCLSCSDSIVVSAPVSDKSPYPALIAVSIKSIQIAHALLDMGFLVRGGIAVGNVHRTNSNILGTGFQKAVKEDKGNPRIVLTESAEQELKKLKNEGSRYWNSSFFSKDEAGQIILNSIHPQKEYLPDKNGDPGDYFRKYRETILKNLSSNDLNTDVRQKWLWFAELFNENVKQLFSPMTGQEPPPSIDIDERLPTITLNYLNPLDPNWMEAFKAPGYVVRFNKPDQQEIMAPGSGKEKDEHGRENS